MIRWREIIGLEDKDMALEELRFQTFFTKMEQKEVKLQVREPLLPIKYK
jgi:hypothetical protein